MIDRLAPPVESKEGSHLVAFGTGGEHVGRPEPEPVRVPPNRTWEVAHLEPDVTEPLDLGRPDRRSLCLVDAVLLLGVVEGQRGPHSERFHRRDSVKDVDPIAVGVRESDPQPSSRLGGLADIDAVLVRERVERLLRLRLEGEPGELGRSLFHDVDVVGGASAPEMDGTIAPRARSETEVVQEAQRTLGIRRPHTDEAHVLHQTHWKQSHSFRRGRPPRGTRHAVILSPR